MVATQSTVMVVLKVRVGGMPVAESEAMRCADPRNVALILTDVRAAHRTFDMWMQSFQAVRPMESKDFPYPHQPYAVEPIIVRDSQ
jgi:hypothetical protein